MDTDQRVERMVGTRLTNGKWPALRITTVVLSEHDDLKDAAAACHADAAAAVETKSVCGDTLHTANAVYECTLQAPHFGDRHYDAPKKFGW